MTTQMFRHAVLDINLAALRANYRLLCDRMDGKEVAAAVKANAYGLGAVEITRSLMSEGCKRFFVAGFGEAVALRAGLPDAPIATLHGVPAGAEDEAVRLGITPVLNDLGALTAWRQAAQRFGRFLPAYVHLDTGMNRLGLPAPDIAALIADPALLSGISIRAWISHFACADDPSHPLNTQQRDRFADMLKRLPPAPASLANSSGIFLGRGFQFDIARAGCALYGINPTPAQPNPMQAVATLRAPILEVRRVDSGHSVGYGASHRFATDGRVAVLGLGYADGYRRILGNKGWVVIGGMAAPVIGRISMDLVTVDVTALPKALLAPGTLADVMGPHRTVDQVASEAGTIGYEILTGLGARLVRRYQG
jgi:alanine racemase